MEEGELLGGFWNGSAPASKLTSPLMKFKKKYAAGMTTDRLTFAFNSRPYLSVMFYMVYYK